MKFKFKTIATAATLALASVSSFAAAINFTATPDLLFVAWDGSGALPGATYVRDLGSVSQLGTTNLTFSAPTGSIFGTQFTGVSASNIYWNVFALDNTNGNEWLTGSNTTLSAANIGQFNAQGTISGLVTTQFVTLQDPANGYTTTNGVEFRGTANQGVTGDGTNGFSLSGTASQGTTGAGKGVGSSLNLLKLDSSSDPVTISQLFTNTALSNATFGAGNVNGGYFSLVDASGTVTWTNAAGVSAVPVPAAALLFGPGLLAVLSAARRRRQG
jgi:hypothetical protein